MWENIRTQFPIITQLILSELSQGDKTYLDLFTEVSKKMLRDYSEIDFNEEMFSDALGELEEKGIITSDKNEEGKVIWKLEEKR